MVADGKSGLTGCELATVAVERAQQVASLSVRRTPVVAVCLPLSVELVCQLVAAVTGNFTVCLLDPSASAGHRAAVVAALAPDVVVDENGTARVDSPAPSPVPDDPGAAGYVAMSSGSTGGAPKAVLSGWASIAEFVAAGAEALELDSDSVWAEASHLAYDMAITNALVALASGAQLQLSPSLGDRLRPLRFAERVGATHLRVAPRFVDLAVAEQRPAPSSLRVWASGGDRLQSVHVGQLHHLGVPVVVNTYGTSETIGFASAARFPRGGTVPSDRGVVPIGAGQVGPWSVELVQADTDDAQGPNTLAIRSVHLPDGLIFGSAVGDFPAWGDGVVVTGDVGLQIDGQYFCLGRSGRRVKRNGLFVNLDDVDVLVRSQTGLSSLTVLTSGGRLVTLVESRGGLEELRGRLVSELSPDLVPDEVVAVAQVPRLSNGKVDHAAAGAMAQSAHASVAAALVAQPGGEVPARDGSAGEEP